METLELALMLVAAVLVSSIIDQMVPRLSMPLIQIGLGLIIALFAPSNITVTLDPELFLVLLISPLLFNEAKYADKVELWRNRGPVLSLAIGLVVATVLVVGFAVHAIVPSLSLAAAFAIGAALGPTDAVAVSSLSGVVDIPERQKGILEGECLLNDASGIVSFQFAVAAAVTGAFSLVEATKTFAFMFFGGLVVGLILAVFASVLLRWVRFIGMENNTFHVLFEVLFPFLVYLVAEAFEVSGIIAVVMAGICNVLESSNEGPYSSRASLVSSSVWPVLTFALNGIVFLLLGTQLPRAIQGTWEDVAISNWTLIAWIIGIFCLVYIARFAWTLAMEFVNWFCKTRWSGRSFGLAEVKAALITTLAGAKGTVTLAILFTLPYNFRQRELIIFLGCGVILVSLLVATFVVPILAPKGKKEAGQELEVWDENLCKVQILNNVVNRLGVQVPKENRRASRVVIQGYNDRIQRIVHRGGADDKVEVALRMKAISWEEECVVDLMALRSVDRKVAFQYIARLGRFEDLLTHRKTGRDLQHTLLHVRAFFASSAYGVRERFSDAASPQNSDGPRYLQLRCSEYALAKLERMAAESGQIQNSEQMDKLLVEYRHEIQRLKEASGGALATTAFKAKVEDVWRLAFSLELDEIQAMQDADHIDREYAKRLREDVLLMQMNFNDSL